MASIGQRVAGSNRDVVRAYLVAHPDHHRPSEIAQATGLNTHQAAVACYGLFEHGEAARGKRAAVNGRRPHNTYGITPAGRRAHRALLDAAESVGAAGQGGA